MTHARRMLQLHGAQLTARHKAFSWIGRRICKTLLSAVTYLLCGTGVGVV